MPSLAGPAPTGIRPMLFPCPACAAPITVHPPKPGRYNPKCPKCGVPFVLAIQINPPASGAVRPPAPAGRRGR